MKIHNIIISLVFGSIAYFLVGCADSESINSHDVATPAVKKDPRVIYGVDNRRDLYEVTNSNILDLADSTVALFKPHRVHLSGLSANIQGPTLQNAHQLCDSEPFHDQPAAAFCSGFLIAPDLIATAGHCIRTQSDCDSTLFAFGWAISNHDQLSPLDVPSDQVYQCLEVVHSQVSLKGSDFAIIRLDRTVPDHTPLLVRQSGEIQSHSPLLVIGHPSGLPTKVADGAQVRSVEDHYFKTNLDTYGGNSGSAVFNVNTGEVEGILVRGATDYVSTSSQCRVSNRCAEDSCQGEDVTKISELLPYINLSTPVIIPNTNYSNTVIPEVTIPDFPGLERASMISTSEAPLGRKVEIEVHISHSWRGDLQISIVSPSGISALLHQRSGRFMDNIHGTYGLDLTAHQDLNQLSQETQTGDWTLTVKDLARRDTGILHSWSIKFTP